MALRSCGLITICVACGSAGNAGPSGPAGVDAKRDDGGRGAIDSRGGSDSVDAHGDAADMQLVSTLTSPCATLQGRAIVNYNDNLGISFTESDSPYTFLGSVQFELPDGFTGEAPDPENWDGSSPRHVIAMTDAGFDLHGNHCWTDSQPPPGGTLVIDDYEPEAGIVKATFASFALHSCTDDSVCTVSGSITTTGNGVFD